MTSASVYRRREVRRWFPVAAHGRNVRVGADLDWVPTTRVHLKQLGQMWTACGVATHDWRVMWLCDLRHVPDLCGECVGIVRDAGDQIGRPTVVVPVAKNVRSEFI